MSDRGPIDPFGVAEIYTDALADIEHGAGMVSLTFSRTRRADRLDGGLVVVRVLMTRETYEAMRRRLADDRGTPQTDYEAGNAGCAGSC